MSLPPALLDRLSSIDALQLHPAAPLSRYTRFRLGGPCLLLADATTPDAFAGAYRILTDSGIPWTSIGGGTNLVVSDNGYPGIVLRYTAASLRVEDRSVHVDAGADLNLLIDFANLHGLAGMESMAGIPGWTGAAIYGNAGAYGQSIHQRVSHVDFFDGAETLRWSNVQCGFRYRHSRFKEDRRLQILSAMLTFEPGDRAALEARSRHIRATRDAKFPPTMACAGSIFKNFLLQELPERARAAVPPEKIIEGKVPAGWFLEQVGARGLQNGGIHVAAYHANLIYNDGSGTAAELLALLAELKRRVRDQFDLPLEEEVQYLGFDHA